MNITELETKVLEIIWHSSFDYGTDAKEISRETGLDIKTVKGALGSLVKKKLAFAETEERGGVVFHDIFPVFNGKVVAFDGENMDQDEYDEMDKHRKSILGTSED